ncbi:MAG: transposase [Rhodospirillales bacterium]|nr:transposase [Rhodospirillales bacterium]
MSGIRFSDDFKKDAVSQVVDRGYSVSDVAERLQSLPWRVRCCVWKNSKIEPYSRFTSLLAAVFLPKPLCY